MNAWDDLRLPSQGAVVGLVDDTNGFRDDILPRARDTSTHESFPWLGWGAGRFH